MNGGGCGRVGVEGSGGMRCGWIGWLMEVVLVKKRAGSMDSQLRERELNGVECEIIIESKFSSLLSSPHSITALLFIPFSNHSILPSSRHPHSSSARDGSRVQKQLTVRGLRGVRAKSHLPFILFPNSFY